MREDFLYHIWKFRKFNSEALKTSEGEELNIIHPGTQNELSGPDFFNSKIQIGEQLWAGNVEMHLKSSDWYFHHHEKDSNYDNVILHVVWINDTDIYRKNNSVIPTLELFDKIDGQILDSYHSLLEKEHVKINCENVFEEFSDFQLQHWMERLYFERLESKSRLILQLLKTTGNNWEWVLFIMLCRSFGLNVNAEAFMNLAQNIDFKIIQKLCGQQFSLEALLFGQAKLIQENDKYGVALLKEYGYLKNKFSLQNDHSVKPQFFRLRPDNFPTIRLAQLSALYANRNNLFYELMNRDEVGTLKELFDIEISEYWQTHYNFSKKHNRRAKKLSSNFIELILINCVIPIKHCYAQYIGQENEQNIQDLITNLKLERNSVISVFNELRPGTAKNAMESQALLQLKNEYCNLNHCLQCELGASLLKKSPKYI